MDIHFKTAEIGKNLPILLALIGSGTIKFAIIQPEQFCLMIRGLTSFQPTYSNWKWKVMVRV